MPRFFAEIVDTCHAIIKGKDVAHITGPLRKNIGDEISIRDYNIGYKGRIRSIDKGKLIVDIEEQEILHERSEKKIRLGICLITMKEMDSLVRFATELGVADIVPVVASRSNIRGVSEKRYLRWRGIVMEAIKQSQRQSILKIHNYLSMENFARFASDNWPNRLVGDHSSNIRLKDITSYDAGILIGSEGGFTSQEINMLHTHGFTFVSMGKTILRSVTAALAAAAILGA